MLDYVLLGLGVIAVGVVVMLVAMLSSRREAGKGGETKGAVVFMVGPIPIIFGNDPRLIVIAMVLAVILIVLALVAGFW